MSTAAPDGMHPNDRLWLYLRDPAPHLVDDDWTYEGEQPALGELFGNRRLRLMILVSVQDVGDELWLHLSASKSRDNGLRVLPTWEDLDMLRGLFFRPESVVLQVHPPVEEHFSISEVLHLWERVTPAERLVPDLRRVDPFLGVKGI